ncbi:flagellar protein FlaG [Brevundimonas sp.]|uniref:flagellar protein FlaG n=1 Tax=Brevundimonas sp. TaxID=1871086 RepID=UPI0039E341AE
MVSASASSGSGDFGDSKPSQEAERLARYRLVIEEGAAKGAFVYKILDRETGEVIRQLPREEVARIGDQNSYAAGAVIDTRA